MMLPLRQEPSLLKVTEVISSVWILVAAGVLMERPGSALVKLARTDSEDQYPSVKIGTE